MAAGCGREGGGEGRGVDNLEEKKNLGSLCKRYKRFITATVVFHRTFGVLMLMLLVSSAEDGVQLLDIQYPWGSQDSQRDPRGGGTATVTVGIAAAAAAATMEARGA